MQAEFTTVGRVVTSSKVKTFEYKDWVAVDRPYWWWESLFVLVVFVYSVEEGVELVTTMNRRRRAMVNKSLKGGSGELIASAKSFVRADALIDAYFEDGWNVLDLLNYALAMIVIAIECKARAQMHSAVEIVNSGRTESGLDSPLVDGVAEFDRDAFFGSFVAMYAPAHLSELAYTLMGCNAVITWLKLLKYFAAFPHLAMIEKTLSNACACSDSRDSSGALLLRSLTAFAADRSSRARLPADVLHRLLRHGPGVQHGLRHAPAALLDLRQLDDDSLPRLARRL